jgi:hypothetical protein
MNKMLAYFTFAISLLFLSRVANASGDVYTFRDSVFPEKRISIDISGKNFLVADSALKMSVCQDSDEFLCVVTDAFAFFVPKKIEQGQREWSVKAHKYVVESIERYGILGWNGSLMRIRGESTNGVTYFLYSKHAGLVGISIVAKNSGSHTTYLLDGKCGYGAAPACNQY